MAHTPLTIRDIEDAIVEAEANFKKIHAQAEADFYRPMYEQQLAVLMASMSEEEIAAMAITDPSIREVIRKMAGAKQWQPQPKILPD